MEKGGKKKKRLEISKQIAPTDVEKSVQARKRREDLLAVAQLELRVPALEASQESSTFGSYCFNTKWGAKIFLLADNRSWQRGREHVERLWRRRQGNRRKHKGLSKPSALGRVSRQEKRKVARGMCIRLVWPVREGHVGIARETCLQTVTYARWTLESS
jgi:hypothetical protein